MSSVRCSPQISIHAPAKGATQAWTSIQPALQFQSTLPRRERLPKIPLDTKYQGISIHAPAKGATVFPVSCKCCSGISIHAPAKGATTGRPKMMRTTMHFNPRSREGSDASSVAVGATISDFNPRSREGSDGHAGSGFSSGLYFNPRSREGSDTTGSTCSPCSP